jgi:hypothetical protein
MWYRDEAYRHSLYIFRIETEYLWTELEKNGNKSRKKIFEMSYLEIPE